MPGLDQIARYRTSQYPAIQPRESKEPDSIVIVPVPDGMATPELGVPVVFSEGESATPIHIIVDVNVPESPELEALNMLVSGTLQTLHQPESVRRYFDTPLFASNALATLTRSLSQKISHESERDDIEDFYKNRTAPPKRRVSARVRISGVKKGKPSPYIPEED